MKIIYRLFALAALCGVASAATHIQSTLRLNDGTTAMAGKIYVTGPSGSTTTPSTSQTVTIGTAGAVDFYLTGCQGCTYRAQYQLVNSRGTVTLTFLETWVVPDTTDVVTVPQLQGGSSAPYYLIGREQINAAGLAAGQMWIRNSGNTAWVAGAVSNLTWGSGSAVTWGGN